MTDQEFEELLEEAKRLAATMTPEQWEQQRRSFVYGNLKLSNPDITREMVDQIADEMAKNEKGRSIIDD